MCIRDSNNPNNHSRRRTSHHSLRRQIRRKALLQSLQDPHQARLRNRKEFKYLRLRPQANMPYPQECT